MTLKLNGTNSEAAPAYAGDDADTGLQCGTNELKLVTGGTARATVDSSGRVLVGETSTSVGSTMVLSGRSDNATGGSRLYMSTATTSPANGSQLGGIYFSDDSENAGAVIEVQRDGGTWTSGSSHPSRIAFATTADGAATPTERVRINSAGNVKLTGGQALFWDDAGDRYIACVGDTTSNINLHGRANVIFKTGGSSYDGGTERARVTSNGLTFNGDTAAANALDDYEEGTFTPAINRQSSAPTVSYSYRSGSYVKIGKLVLIYFDLNMTANSGGSGRYRITGLPFSTATDNLSGGYGSPQFRESSAFNSDARQNNTSAFHSDSLIQLLYMNNSGNETDIGVSTGRITGWSVYMTNS
jgi:hypothetical protein